VNLYSGSTNVNDQYIFDALVGGFVLAVASATDLRLILGYSLIIYHLISFVGASYGELALRSWGPCCCGTPLSITKLM
jgi:hypothetical protein